MVSTMLQKTIQIWLTNQYLPITNEEKYYAPPMDLDVIKCLALQMPLLCPVWRPIPHKRLKIVHVINILTITNIKDFNY